MFSRGDSELNGGRDRGSRLCWFYLATRFRNQQGEECSRVGTALRVVPTRECYPVLLSYGDLKLVGDLIIDVYDDLQNGGHHFAKGGSFLRFYHCSVCALHVPTNYLSKKTRQGTSIH